MSTEKADHSPHLPQITETQEFVIASDIPAKQTVRVFHVGDAIRKRRKQASLTLDQLSDKADVARSTLFDLEKTGEGYRDDTLKKVAAALGTSPAELLRDVTAARFTAENRDDTAGGGEGGRPSGANKPLPVITEAQAGEGGLLYDEPASLDAYAERTIERPPGLRDPNAFGVLVRGDSMVPIFRPGLIVVVSPAMGLRPGGDEAFVALRSGERVVKIVHRTQTGLILESANPQYALREVWEHDVHKVYPVVLSFRRDW